MVFHGFWLVPMVFQGGFMVFHGFWLVSIVFQGGFMVFHGSFMVSHGFWLVSMFVGPLPRVRPRNGILALFCHLGLSS